MSTDLYKIVKFSDGEGVVYDDFDNTNKFLAAKLTDQIFEKLVGAPGYYDPHVANYQGANVSTNYAYALTVGGAVPMQGSTTSKIKLGAGTLFQKISNANGNNSTFLPYTFDGTDEFTISAGHATLNRVDMLQMKLELVDTDSTTRDFKDATTGVVTSTTFNKKNRVQCTLSVKSGTAATNPVYPTPDAGYVPIACVVVGATWAGAERMYFADVGGARTAIHDLRMPVGIHKFRAVMAAAYGVGGDWRYSSGDAYCYCNSSAGHDWLYVPCHSPVGRLVAVAAQTANDVAGANGIMLGSGGQGFRMADITTALLNATTSTHLKVAKLSDIESSPIFDSHHSSSSMSYTVSGNGTHGLPVWTNGKRGIDPVGEIYSGDETISSGVGVYEDDVRGLDLMVEARDSAVPVQEIRKVEWFVATGI